VQENIHVGSRSDEAQVGRRCGDSVPNQMKDEFAWLRVIILFSAAALVLSVVVRVCRETAQQRAALEAAMAAALNTTNGQKSGNQAAPFPPCRIVPTGWIENKTTANPE